MDRLLFIGRKFYFLLVVVWNVIKDDFFAMWETKRGRVILIAFGCFIIFSFFTYVFFLQVPHTFPEHSLFAVPEGATLTQISEKLYNQGYIISPFWFKVFVILGSGDNSLQAGDYFFPTPENILSIAPRLARGDFGLVPERITIPEGLNVFQIAEIFKTDFPQFNAEEFIKNAPEGYLFPDTYFFLPNIKAKDVITAMTQNFDRQIVAVKEDIEKFGKPLEDVIKMASILEEEARVFETRQIVAGILWKRIGIGMLLQVDASFSYVNGKNSFTLTTDDLQIDSLYNSYKYKGLPPTPISNPGLESIQAAVTPIETKYLYFLTDKTGVMRYSADYEGHLKNRRLYLGK